MLKVLAFIIDGCWHQWEIIQAVDLHTDGVEFPIGKKYVYKCKKCQKIKSKKDTQ
jgi:hypothetical protein